MPGQMPCAPDVQYQQSKLKPARMAIGNGGQRLFLLPGRDLVVGVTAGNYDNPDGWRPSTAMLRDVLLPALRPA